MAVSQDRKIIRLARTQYPAILNLVKAFAPAEPEAEDLCMGAWTAAGRKNPGISVPLIGRTCEHAGQGPLGPNGEATMTRQFRRTMVRVAAAMAACILTAASANALIIVTPRTEQPDNSQALQLTAQTVHVDLSDRAAEVSVEFTYHNSSPWMLEGTYLFPLPPEAAVDRFSLFVDGEEIRAELLDVEEARQTYESIVRSIKDPALLEYVDRQLLKARIFPIQPNSDAKIKLYYTHPLIADFGTTDFVFPFSIEQRAPDANISLTAEIITTSPLKSATSPTHDINVAHDGLNHATVTSPVGAWQGADVDFHLLCTYDTRELGAQFLTAMNDDGERFFMGIIAPGESAQGAILPKDVVFCFDRSGSMEGEKIEQARKALQFCLGKLNAEDRFGLIVFNDGIGQYASELRKASASEISGAREFVNGVDADGGTFIDGAMQRSLEMFAPGERPKYLVFLTDGLPTVGERNPDVITRNVHDRNREHARIFTFGVGYDLNAALLNDLAGGGNGLASYVEPGEDVEVKVSNFFRKISRPVLTDCRLEFEGGMRVRDVYPGDLPDVYAGSEIVVVGRYEGTGTLTAHLAGSRGAEVLNHTFTAPLEPKRGRYEFIPKLWAGRRIGYLLEDMRKNGETQEVKSEVVRLSKEYGIMTPYTAYLAAPEEVRLAVNMRTVTPDQIRSMPVTNVADILKNQVGAGVRNDTFHIRGGRSNMFTIQPETEASMRNYGGSGAQAQAKKDISSAQLYNAPSVARLSGPPRERALIEEEPSPSLTVAGKQFTFMNGTWTDWELVGKTDPPADTIAVKPYSDAYFRLTKSSEIARFLTVGNPLIFLWHNVVIKIDESGAESWNTAWDKSL